MNIALISPSKESYSETFIQVHKEGLEGNVYYYHDGEVPVQLEGNLMVTSRKKRLLDIFKGHFRLNRFSLAEQAVMDSFKRNRIDVVFAEYGTVGNRMLPICKELKLPLITHFHGFDASEYETLKNHDYYKELFEYASYIVVVSKKMYNDFLSLGCPKSSLVYNVYGPREDFFKVQPDFSKQQFIAIGRFTDKKAPYYLILSFKEVVKKYPNAKLIIAGDGELWNTCRNLVVHYGLEENIELPGIISKERYIKYLSESLAMVQHSITAADGDSEGTPVAILEASAAGIPVVATRHAGIPDVIQHGETGLLVNEHDVEGMTDAMLQIMSDTSEAQIMGKKARKRINSEFNINYHIKTLDKLVHHCYNG